MKNVPKNESSRYLKRVTNLYILHKSSFSLRKTDIARIIEGREESLMIRQFKDVIKDSRDSIQFTPVALHPFISL
jgi:hypothetical protein